MSCRPHQRIRPGFTLVELLVVIGIIALLVAILLPALNKAKKQANALLCSSDMRQIMQAMVQYALDNKDRLPSAPWIGVRPTDQYAECAFTFDADAVANYKVGSLWKYLGGSPQVRAKLMACPDDDFISPFDQSIKRNYSYSFNYQININGAAPKTDTLKLSRVRMAGQKIIIFEERLPNDGYCVWTLWDADALTKRHNGRCNAAFADGHIERYFPPQIFARPDYCDLTRK